MSEVVRVSRPTLFVLVGPASAGKSTWADEHFEFGEIISSDRLRGQVGRGEWDQDASADAFALLELILEMRIARRLTTVIDTLGFDQPARRRWVLAAQAAEMAVVAVLFNTPAAVCRERNRARKDPVPARVLNGQITRFRAVRAEVAEDGFTSVIDAPPTAIARIGSGLEVEYAPPSNRRPADRLRFGLSIARFDWKSAETGDRLTELAQASEEAGFSSIWVMDHLRQIPQVGRAWDPLLESYTTLAFLAGVTKRAELGVLVTYVGFRNVALLGKILASLDVLSGGRARCGLGAGWFKAEAEAFGYDFPAAGERLDLLEDALQALPLVWGAGGKPFQGRRIHIPEAMSYPRPLQSRIPILVGGGGERRTLRLVAQYADACNLFGSPRDVAQKVAVLHEHCAQVQRDPKEINITHLGPALAARDHAELSRLLEQHRPARVRKDTFASEVNAGTVHDLIEFYRHYQAVGVSEVMVGLIDATPDGVGRFAPIIEAFSDVPAATP